MAVAIAQPPDRLGCDISWAIRTYNVVPIRKGETLARELNRKFVR